IGSKWGAGLYQIETWTVQAIKPYRGFVTRSASWHGLRIVSPELFTGTLTRRPPSCCRGRSHDPRNATARPAPAPDAPGPARGALDPPPCPGVSPARRPAR